MNLILPSGHEVLMDAEDHERLCGFKYYLHPKGYAYRFVDQKDGYDKRTTIYLHHDIVGHHSDKVVDHRNRNKLDNRRNNLRVVSNLQNLHNSGKQKGIHTSAYKGVCWIGRDKAWHSTAQSNEGKQIKLGLFSTEEAAAHAYNDYVQQHRGEYAYLNEVPDDHDWESKRIPNRREGAGKSKFIGVSWSKGMGKWQAHIMVNYKSIYLGCFEEELDAAKAYNDAAIEHRGTKARLNNLE